MKGDRKKRKAGFKKGHRPFNKGIIYVRKYKKTPERQILKRLSAEEYKNLVNPPNNLGAGLGDVMILRPKKPVQEANAHAKNITPRLII